MASGKRHEGERRKCGDASRLRARVPRDEARRGRHSALCIFARLLSSSLLSYPRLVVSHALYLDACRRVLAARACSRARASQKYVILLLYIYIYIYALVSMRPPRGIFALWPWCVVPRETLQRPDASKLCSNLSTAYPLRLMADSRNFVKRSNRMNFVLFFFFFNFSNHIYSGTKNIEWYFDTIIQKYSRNAIKS